MTVAEVLLFWIHTLLLLLDFICIALTLWCVHSFVVGKTCNGCGVRYDLKHLILEVQLTAPIAIVLTGALVAIR